MQAEFKEGMFDGKYQEYSHNALRREGSYKEGRKNGLFREYVGGALTQEYTFRNDTLDGAFNDLGDTLSIENYANDLLDGEKVVFEPF